MTKPLPKYTYLLYNSDRDAVKIGSAIHVRSRIQGIQTAHISKLELLGVLSGDTIETHLHKRFEGDRIRGEWFHFSQDLRFWVGQHEESLTRGALKTNVGDHLCQW